MSTSNAGMGAVKESNILLELKKSEELLNELDALVDGLGARLEQIRVSYPTVVKPNEKSPDQKMISAIGSALEFNNGRIFNSISKLKAILSDLDI